VLVGEDTIIVSQVGIAGSTRIGDHCTFGGQAGIAGHAKIGNDVTIAARGGVAGDIADGQVLSGAPAMPHKDWLKASMTFPKLPEIRRDVQQLKKKLAELENLLKEK
jgi:UDP-3-O-[3-hydroxymyristoyl] glucosamine N-acyltransferase